MVTSMDRMALEQVLIANLNARGELRGPICPKGGKPRHRKRSHARREASCVGDFFIFWKYLCTLGSRGSTCIFDCSKKLVIFTIMNPKLSSDKISSVQKQSGRTFTTWHKAQVFGYLLISFLVGVFVGAWFENITLVTMALILLGTIVAVVSGY